MNAQLKPLWARALAAPTPAFEEFYRGCLLSKCRKENLAAGLFPMGGQVRVKESHSAPIPTAILAYLRDHPGALTSDVAAAVGHHVTGVSGRLRDMCEDGLARRERVTGAGRVLYRYEAVLPGDRPAEAQPTVVTAILEHVRRHPGCTSVDVSKHIDLKRRATNDRLSRLVDDGFLTRWRESDGHPYSYEVTP